MIYIHTFQYFRQVAQLCKLILPIFVVFPGECIRRYVCTLFDCCPYINAATIFLFTHINEDYKSNRQLNCKYCLFVNLMLQLLGYSMACGRPPCMPFKWPLSYVQPVTVASAPLTAVLLCSIATCCVTTADVKNAFKMFSKLGCGKVYWTQCVVGTFVACISCSCS